MTLQYKTSLAERQSHRGFKAFNCSAGCAPDQILPGINSISPVRKHLSCQHIKFKSPFEPIAIHDAWSDLFCINHMAAFEDYALGTLFIQSRVDLREVASGVAGNQANVRKVRRQGGGQWGCLLWQR